MPKTKKLRIGNGTEKQENPSNMLLSKMLPQDLFRNSVLEFLDRDSVRNCISVEEFSKEFQLPLCFCAQHGTRLGQVVLEPGPPKKGCVDCEMDKIGRARCCKCDDFFDFLCGCDACGKSSCRDCMGTARCSACYKQNCRDCICGVRHMEYCCECNNLLRRVYEAVAANAILP